MNKNKYLFKFKNEHPFEKRESEAKRIREKYPDRIPVIVERDKKSQVSEIDKRKYLVPEDLTVGQFIYVIRKRIKVSPQKAIYIFTENGTIPPTSSFISKLYDTHKSNDGFLYILYSGENTFGY